jgi:hypothetical protein
VQYDYEKAEDNEIELVEGQYVTNIDQVDDDWWMGTNSKGETGLFPSNYVELAEGGEDDGPAPPTAPVAAQRSPSPPPAAQSASSGAAGKTATAQYDYEAAEDNELSFPDGATIQNVVCNPVRPAYNVNVCANTIQEFPDEDWWFGEYGGKSGLFPANYVQIDD